MGGGLKLKLPKSKNPFQLKKIFFIHAQLKTSAKTTNYLLKNGRNEKKNPKHTNYRGPITRQQIISLNYETLTHL